MTGVPTGGPAGNAELERVGFARANRARPGLPASGWQRFTGIVLLLVAWELASRVGWLDRRSLPAPSSAVDVAWSLTRDGTLPRALWASTQRVLWALAIGSPVGAGLALIAGRSRTGDAVIDANVQMLRYVPILAMQPLLIRWLGVGETMKVALLAGGVAFPVYVNTYAAIRGLDARYHDLADVLRLTTWQRARRVVAPGALPGFLVGFRYAAAVAWLLLVVAEQTNAPDGLGRLMAESQAFLRTDRVVVVILMYTMLGVVCDVTIRAVEARLLRWRPRR